MKFKEPLTLTLTISTEEQAYALWHFFNHPSAVLSGKYLESYPHLKDILPADGRLHPDQYTRIFVTIDHALKDVGKDPHLPLEEFCRTRIPVLPVREIGGYKITYNNGILRAGCVVISRDQVIALADFLSAQETLSKTPKEKTT